MRQIFAAEAGMYAEYKVGDQTEYHLVIAWEVTATGLRGITLSEINTPDWVAELEQHMGRDYVVFQRYTSDLPRGGQRFKVRR